MRCVSFMHFFMRCISFMHFFMRCISFMHFFSILLVFYLLNIFSNVLFLCSVLGIFIVY